MLSANLSGYPTRPDLKAIREYVRAGGENPFTAGVKKAVQDQLRAGVDIVTDGQVRQVTDLLASNVPGMRMDDHPRIENTVGTPRNTTAELDFITAARECGDAARVKAVLPGPFSFADSCVLDAKAPYRSKHDVNLLFDIASVLRYEIDALRENHWFFYGIGLFVSFLTVYYSFRLLFVILFSKTAPKPQSAHPESVILKFACNTPLIFLASISLFVGALGTSFTHYPLFHWLGGEALHTNAVLIATMTTLIILGAGIAYFQFKDPETALIKLETSRGPLKTLLDNKFYIDDLYDFLVEQVSHRIARLFEWFDRTIINGIMVNQTAYSVMRLGRLGSRLQDGLLQDYLSIALGIGVVIIFWIIKST